MAHRLRRLLQIAVIIATTLATPAWAQVDARVVDQEVTAAVRSVTQGRVKEAIDRLATLFGKIDPANDKNAYWRAGSELVEVLSQAGHHSHADRVLSALASSKVPESHPSYFRWMQFYLGRNLADRGKAQEGEKFLRALTGGDARLVDFPAQRAAAVILSEIELDRGNIAQAGLWMRRAVIGTLAAKSAGSEEIIDVLRSYAIYMARTRRLPEAYNLFRKLVPIYETQYSHRDPKYLYFMSRFLLTLTEIGDFKAAEVAYKALRDNAVAVDIIPENVRDQLFFQELYQIARASPASGQGSITERLNHVIAGNPHFLKQPRNRIFFTFFALLAGDVALADQFLSTVQEGAPADAQFAAYEAVLRSFIAARRSNFDESLALARDALDRIRLFHQVYESESSSRSPAITSEERLVLGLIAGLAAPHISTADQANTLFQLQQFLNRDKGKLGLHARVARQSLKSDLQREDIRTRDRLQDLRDRILDEATEVLFARILPIRDLSPAQGSDYSFLIRLDDIEDKIANADDQLGGSASEFSKSSTDSPIELGSLQRLLRPGEALVLHGWVGGAGLVTTCITSDTWTFHVKWSDKSGLQQFVIDEKLLSAAVRARHRPSAALDASFPGESAHRLYQALFGGIEPCLRNKAHLLLATDPDFFSLPWNALLTKPPSGDQEFRHRAASWLPRSYALSLLPSVRSLHQLRVTLPPSRAADRFLGVGDPDFKGTLDKATEVALAPLFVSRGVANREAIAALPRLPDSADELRVIAKALGSSNSDILLAREATERALRKRPLNDYRVISFATHAVVAGEIDGTTEPALVLSPGEDEKNEQNDGLLTATEIANLVLDANLVILSACNTAASDGRANGRGLSGLADAFFFAGARALAVTQWAVFSDAAKQLGAGLVSRPLKSQGVGVAEGLRQTMVDYVAAAKEDHLAHPRFWAAFMIAGDGAVRPLDGAAAIDDARNPVKLEWEHVTPNSADSHLIGIAKTTRPLYAIGIEKPPVGGKRAGSYFARVQAGKSVEVISRDPETAASGVVALDNDIAVLGFLPSDTKSSAVFQLLDNDGRERWRHVQDSSLWQTPVSMLRTANGFILVSIEIDDSLSPPASALVLTRVSERGATETQRRFPIPLRSPWSSPRHVSLDGRGHLVIAIAGTLSERPVGQPAVWTNPRTGSKRVCVVSDATHLFSIDPLTLDIRSQKTIYEGRIAALRQLVGRVYAAFVFTTNCRVERSAKLFEVGAGLELKTIFQADNINSIEVTDFAATKDHFVLVGIVRTFLPTALTREMPSREQRGSFDPWAESFWERSEEHASAIVLVLAQDGTILADRVFPDVRNRHLSSVVADGAGRFIAVGSAFGDRGWAIAFTLRQAGLDGPKGFPSWLRWLLRPFGWANERE